MSKLLRGATRWNKTAVSVPITLTIQCLRFSSTDLHDGTHFDVAISRSNKRQQTQLKPVTNGAVVWNEPLSMICTLYADQHMKYQSKLYKVV